MKNSFKLLAIAASITLTGCASTPYNAGQYALENQRLASETSLEAVEPDEQFSDAMKIMYDYSQVDVDYKNNLDEPYVKGKSLTKDVISLGGTAALIANGAKFADIGSFFFATNYEKTTHYLYSNNVVLRYVDVSDLLTNEEINKEITSHRDSLAIVLKNAYEAQGVKTIELNSTNLSKKATESWNDSSNYIIPLSLDDKDKNYSHICDVPVEENVKSLTDIGFVRNTDCQARIWQKIEVTNNNTSKSIPAFKGKGVSKYVIITAFLPKDFPMGKLRSSYAYDYAYKPAFSWFDNPYSYAQAYGEDMMEQKLKNGDVSMLPELIDLNVQKNVLFTYQKK